MARAVYSRRLFAGTVNSDGAAHTVYTVPANFTTVIRYATLYVNAALTDVYVQESSSTPGPVIWRVSGAVDTWHDWEGRYVLEAGDAVIVFTTLSSVRITLHGYELAH